jgi:hypothetical protein
MTHRACEVLSRIVGRENPDWPVVVQQNKPNEIKEVREPQTEETIRIDDEILSHHVFLERYTEGMDL